MSFQQLRNIVYRWNPPVFIQDKSRFAKKNGSREGSVAVNIIAKAYIRIFAYPPPMEHTVPKFVDRKVPYNGVVDCLQNQFKVNICLLDSVVC
jgi:hypothetical protein